jgi:hypothetical protein
MKNFDGYIDGPELPEQPGDLAIWALQLMALLFLFACYIGTLVVAAALLKAAYSYLTTGAV